MPHGIEPCGWQRRTGLAPGMQSSMCLLCHHCCLSGTVSFSPKWSSGAESSLWFQGCWWREMCASPGSDAQPPLHCLPSHRGGQLLALPRAACRLWAGACLFLKAFPAKYESAATGGSAEGAGTGTCWEIQVQSRSKLGRLMFCIKHRAVFLPQEQTQSWAFPGSRRSARIPRVSSYPAACGGALGCCLPLITASNRHAVSVLQLPSRLSSLPSTR